MITALSLKNFKSIKEAKLKLGPFNLFIGANASGKSNLFDALRFLQGIGWGLTIDEILNGRPRAGTGSEWDGVRGGSGFLGWQEPKARVAKAKEVWIEAAIRPRGERAPTEFRYGIGIDLELMKTRAGAEQTQVLATSHSALLLDWLSEEDYQYVFLCVREPETAVTHITPLTEVPHFLESVKTTPASQLISEGWMEMAL